MGSPGATIVVMTRAHIRACEGITSVSEPWMTLNETVDFAAHISRKEAHVYVEKGEVRGFIIFSPGPVFARGGYLRALAVAPSLRGRGLGKKLLSFAERTTARHCPNFFLCVSSFNRPALAFYARCGYARVGKLPGLIVRGASEYIYWKRLRPLPRKPGGHTS